MRALVVDDEAPVLFLLQKYLTWEGFEVVVTTDGEQAIQRVQGEQFDIILLDIMMPNVNGFTVCQEVRKTEINKRTPVVFVTARTDPFGPPSGFKAGGTAYISKPFSRRQIASVVKSVLAKRKKVQENKKKTTAQGRTPNFALSFEEIRESLFSKH